MKSGDSLSKIAKQFIAGLLEHLPALVGLTCPSYVSYERLAPQGEWVELAREFSD